MVLFDKKIVLCRFLTYFAICFLPACIFSDCGGDDDDDDDDDDGTCSSWSQEGSCSWSCGEDDNGTRSCTSGKDLKLQINAFDGGGELLFEAREIGTEWIDFTVAGTKISKGPKWTNFDGSPISTRCATLNCGSGTYLCIIAHDDPQRFRTPSGAKLLGHDIGGGNSVYAFSGSGWNGGTVQNDGSTDGGNNDLSAAFCIQ